MSKKKPAPQKPKVHEELKGFDIRINEFGQIVSNLEIERLNDFLNEKVDDLKLRDRKEDKDEGKDDEE